MERIKVRTDLWNGMECSGVIIANISGFKEVNHDAVLVRSLGYACIMFFEKKALLEAIKDVSKDGD
jgi:hypothetical protein